MLSIAGANTKPYRLISLLFAALLAMEESPATLFFSSLRHIALKLDRSARELRSRVEETRGRYTERDQSIDDPRALLKLSNMLEEAQQLKVRIEPCELRALRNGETERKTV